MRIFFLCDEYPPAPHGGLGSFTQTLAEALVGNGHEVRVIGFFVGDNRREERRNGVQILHLPRRQSRFWSIWQQRLILALELNRLPPPDVLEGPELSLAFLPKQPATTYILRMHGGHAFFSHEQGQKAHPGRAWFEQMSFANADSLCAVSQYVAESTRALLRFPQPVTILPNPVNTNLFAPRGEAEKPGLILFSGTLCRKKGVEELLRAWPLVRSRAPQAHLLLVGRDQVSPRSGIPFSQELRRRLNPACFEGVIFGGRQPHERLPRLMSRASLCVIPSLSESFGISVIEAMSAAKAAAVSDIPPFREIVDEGQTGLFFDPHDPRAVAETLLQALLNPALRQRLGKQARRAALQTYSISALTPKNVDFYQTCRKV